MSPPRVTMQGLVGVVLAVALDFAWIRGLSERHASYCGMEAPAFDIGILWMGSLLLLLGIAALRRRARPSRFLVGFVVMGLAGIACSAYFGRYRPDEMRQYLNSTIPIEVRWGLDPHADLVIYFKNTLVLFPPQLALAWLGGIVAGRTRRRVDARVERDLDRPETPEPADD